MRAFLERDTIAPLDDDAFGPEPAARGKCGAGPLDIVLLVNLAPQDPAAALLSDDETEALIGILRAAVREPRIGRLKLIAFDLRGRRVIYRQRRGKTIDFQALGRAVDRLQFGTIDVAQLREKDGEGEFLARLIGEQAAGAGLADLLIFAGVRDVAGPRAPLDALKPLRGALPAAVQFDYTPEPSRIPWTDTLGRAVKTIGGRQYAITSPESLSRAWHETVARAAALEPVETAALRGR